MTVTTAQSPGRISLGDLIAIETAPVRGAGEETATEDAPVPRAEVEGLTLKPEGTETSVERVEALVVAQTALEATGLGREGVALHAPQDGRCQSFIPFTRARW